MQKAFFFASGTQKNYDDITIEILQEAWKYYANLTESEKKILTLIADGKSTFMITQLLDNSRKTIDTHRYNIRKKLKLNTEISLTQVSKFIVEKIK